MLAELAGRRDLRIDLLTSGLGPGLERRPIAPNILSARLKALGEHALVVQQPYSEHPPRYVYELSAAGAELAGALRLLADWGARTGEGDPLRHSCGAPLEATWWCPTCEEPVRDADEPLTEI